MNADPLTVSITGTVKAGCEADFERALHQLVRRSLLLPGRLGCELRHAAGLTPERAAPYSTLTMGDPDASSQLAQ